MFHKIIKGKTKLVEATQDFDYLSGGEQYLCTEYGTRHKAFRFDRPDMSGGTSLRPWQMCQGLASGALVIVEEY